jgi:hypothetical protein
MDSARRTPAQLRAQRRNLTRGSGPGRGRGRIQKAIERCFVFEADDDGVVDGGTIQRFCQEWRYQCDGYRPSALNRLSVRNVLDQVADRIGRSRGPGRPWLWRLKSSPSGSEPVGPCDGKIRDATQT